MPYTGGYPQPSQLHWVRGRYDFAVDGGAVGAIDLLSGDYIPANAVILGGFVEVETALTSDGSATVALHVQAANDVISAAAYGGAPWSTTGRKSVVPVFTGATSIKTSAAQNIVATIATAALTAGVFDAVLCYVILPD